MQPWLLLPRFTVNIPTRVVNQERVIYWSIHTDNLFNGMKSFIMLHHNSDHYPIYLIADEARIERDVNHRIFRYTCNVDIPAFIENIHEALDEGCTTFPVLLAALCIFLWITAASEFKIFLFFCIVPVLFPHTEPSLLSHVFWSSFYQVST